MAENPNTEPAKPTQEEFDLANTPQQHTVGVPNPQCILNALMLQGILKPNNYQTFGQVTSAGTARTFVSELFKVDAAGSFFTLTSLEKASLVPYVRIFMEDDVGKSSEIPFSFTDTSIKQSGKRTLSNPLGSRIGTDMGITSISIEDLTSQPEEEGSHISVKLSIFLKNLRNIDTPFAGSTVKLTDLISRRDPDDPVFNPQENRIKMIVGWGTPSRVVARGPNKATTKGRIERIKQACMQSRMVLELTLRDHSFSMAENGNVNLDIEYNASSDGFLKCGKVNILDALSPVEKERLAGYEGKIKSIDERMERMRRYNPSIVQAPTDPYKELQEEKKELEEKKSNVIESRNTRYYDRLLNKLLDGYMRRVDIPDVLIGLGDNKKGGAWESFMLGTLDKCKDIDKLLRLSRPREGRVKLEDEDQLQDAIKDKDSAKETITKGLYNVNWGSLSDEAVDEDQELTVTTSSGNASSYKMVKLFYFRFGDIIEVINDAMIQTLADREADTAFVDQMPYVMLGPVDMARKLCVDGRGNSVIGEDGRQISIADIPIEASTFLNFFANRFVRSNARHITYMTFINAVMKELLPRALGEGENCFSSAAAPTVYPNLMPIHCKAGSIPTYGTKRAANMTAQQLRQHIIYDKNYGAKIPRGKFREVILIYAPEIGPADLNFSKAENINQGIYHIIPGEERGILLGFSFTKNNQPFLPEAKVFGEGNIGLGEDISGGNVYNVNLDLIGNTFFRVGSIFYVDMIGMGLGNQANDNSLSRRLYIGGYYTVTKLKYEINLTDFITTLEGVYLPGGGAKLAARNVDRLAELERNRVEHLQATTKVRDWQGTSLPPTTVVDQYRADIGSLRVK